MPNKSTLPDPAEHLEDIIGMCAKVCHENETMNRVLVTDLLDLREAINQLRQHVANGNGYKTVPKLYRSEDDLRKSHK